MIDSETSRKLQKHWIKWKAIYYLLGNAKEHTRSKEEEEEEEEESGSSSDQSQ